MRDKHETLDFDVTFDGPLCLVADPYGIAWGHGADFIEALEDWEIAAREIMEMLVKASALSEDVAWRLRMLRGWFEAAV